MTLTLSTTRDATAEEVDDLVFGTGALSFSWWYGGHKTEHGYRFTFTAPDDAEGTFRGQKWVSNQQILDAAGKYLSEGHGGEDAREAAGESVGYLDAVAADAVLQSAVFGAVVYG